MSSTLIKSCSLNLGVTETEVTDTIDEILKCWNANTDISPKFLRQLFSETFEYLNLIRQNYKKHNSSDEIKRWMESFAGKVTSELGTQISTIKSNVVDEMDARLTRACGDLDCKFHEKITEVKTTMASPWSDMSKSIDSRLEKTEMVVENKLLTAKVESSAQLNLISQSISNVDKVMSTLSTKIDGINSLQNQRDVASSLQSIRSDLSNAISLMGSIPDNEMKRKTSEDYVENTLRKYLPRRFQIRSVAKESNQMDLHIETPRGLLIGIDVKNWNRNVDASETQKTKDLLIRHATLNVGIIVSMKSNIEGSDVIYEQNIGQQKMLWYYPNALEQSINGLVALIIMCDVIYPLLKLEDTTNVDTSLTTLGKYFTAILEIAKSARDIDLNISSLQKTIDKIQQKSLTQKGLIDRLIVTCEEVLENVFKQTMIVNEHHPKNETPQNPTTKKRKPSTKKDIHNKKQKSLTDD